MTGLTPAQAAQQAQQVAAQQATAAQAAQAAGRGASTAAAGLPQAMPPAPPPVPAAEWSLQLQPTAAQVPWSESSRNNFPLRMPDYHCICARGTARAVCSETWDETISGCTLAW